MRGWAFATLLCAGLGGCTGGMAGFEGGGESETTISLDSSWLRVGGVPSLRAIGPQAFADWLTSHPRLAAITPTEREALITGIAHLAGRAETGNLPWPVVDPISLAAATSPNWVLPQSSPINTSAAVLVYGTMPNGATDRMIIEGDDGTTHHIGIVSNLYGGSPTVLKSASIGSRIDGSAILTNFTGTVAYAVTSAGVLYAVNVSDASFAWSVNLGSPVANSTPWLDFNTKALYVADLGGKVTSIDSVTGAVKWVANVTGGVPLHSSPIVLGGMVWVGADNGSLYRLNALTGAAVGQPTSLCLATPCTARDAIWSSSAGDLVGGRLLVGVNRRIVEIDVSPMGCTTMTTTSCSFTAYPIQQGGFVAPAGRFEGALSLDLFSPSHRLYFGYANRLWRADYSTGVASAFSRAGNTGDPTGVLRGWNPTSHGYPRGIPLVFNNDIFVGDGGAVFHRFSASTFNETAWKSYNPGTMPGKGGPAIDSTALIDFSGGNVYFGVARPTDPVGEWNSLPQAFTSDAASAGAAAHFRLAATGFISANATFTVTVTALDDAGRRATGYTGTIHFTSSATGTLPADYTFTPGDQGQRTFSLTLGTTGAQTLTVVDTANTNLLGATGVCVGTSTCGPRVATDAPTYPAGQPVIVSFGFLPGNANDSVVIAPAGSPLTQQTTFKYVKGWIDGATSFLLPAGDYEARVFENGTYTLLASTPFSVISSAVVTTDASSYVSGAPVTVSWTGAAGLPNDWVAISADGSPATSYVVQAPTGGTADGSKVFNVLLAPGTYRARVYYNGTYTIQAESAAFTVSAPGTSVTTNAATYTSGTPIVVSWMGAAGAAGDWVAISAAGSPATSYIRYALTNGEVNGSRTFFAALPPGSYVARLYYNSSYAIQAESVAFTVTPATTAVTTNASSYTPGTPVVVSWTDGPGAPGDFVAISVDGAPVTSFVAYKTIGPVTDGSHTFTVALPPGTYRARFYYHSSYTLLAQSAPFTVGP